VTVVPARTTAEDILELAPDGVFLSNGPGDPAALPGIVDEIKKLTEATPVFGICLGHQLIGRAFGGTTFKLKFGHRGGNQPVKNIRTGQIEITSHNHGFAVDPASINESEIELTHFNLNDGTLEGLRHRHLPVFSVQYHPEAGPGPHDAIYLFEEFISNMQSSESKAMQMCARHSSHGVEGNYGKTRKKRRGRKERVLLCSFFFVSSPLRVKLT
jgi:carbamoyl-phosphate synthase small subunit